MRLRGSSSPSGPTSWSDHKEQGKTAFELQDYEVALSCYAAALNPDLYCPAAERQILLSNIVACRLRIGGTAQAEAAVQAAKQCIALNDQWAKGHVRLASAYIALGGHSNDACNSLQRALQLDPSNPTARDMLVRELRRDRHAGGSTAPQPTPSASPSYVQPTAPPQDQDDRDYATRPPPQYRDVPNNVVDEITLRDRLSFYYNRCKMWYFAQSDDVKTLLKVFVAVLLLYVSFGGRFGLGSTSGVRERNYDSRQYNDPYHGGRRSSEQSSRSRYHDGDDYYGRRQRRRSSSYSFLDGGMQSLLIILGVAYLCHRNGINPINALFILRMIGGRRRRRFYRGGMGGFGGMR